MSRNTTTSPPGHRDHLVVAAAQRLIRPPREPVNQSRLTVSTRTPATDDRLAPGVDLHPDRLAARSIGPAQETECVSSQPRRRAALLCSGSGESGSTTSTRNSACGPASACTCATALRRRCVACACAPHRAASSGPPVAGPELHRPPSPAPTAGAGNSPSGAVSASRIRLRVADRFAQHHVLAPRAPFHQARGEDQRADRAAPPLRPGQQPVDEHPERPLEQQPGVRLARGPSTPPSGPRRAGSAAACRARAPGAARACRARRSGQRPRRRRASRPRRACTTPSCSSAGTSGSVSGRYLRVPTGCSPGTASPLGRRSPSRDGCALVARPRARRTASGRRRSVGAGAAPCRRRRSPRPDPRGFLPARSPSK